MRIALVSTLVLSCAAPSFAQSVAARPQRLVVPRMSFVPLIEHFVSMAPPPELEASMARVEGFTQRWPDDGTPERMKTVAYLGYTDEALHVVYLAFDSDPSLLRAHLLRQV